MITYSSEYQNRRAFNTTATYVCESGYNLIGQTFRTCQGNETWSGDKPTCIGKFFSSVGVCAFICDFHL